MAHKVLNPYKRGDKVRIPKGTPYTTTHPSGRGKVLRTKRAQTVTLHDAYDGYEHERREDLTTKAKIVWAGSGGYWKRVNLEDLP